MEEPSSQADITRLLQRWQGGDASALDEVTPLIYAELHQIATRYLRRERHNHTLQSTALVHEAFVKLVDQRRVDWQTRSHFLGVAAQLMRRILVDYARQAGRTKRGSDVIKLSLEPDVEPVGATGPDVADILTIDRALGDLELLDPRQHRIVEFRFFAGMTVDETADAMGISAGTIKREWAVARAWLFARLSAEPA